MSQEFSSSKDLPVLPRSLQERLGTWRRHRCLSSRDGREVHLVEDSMGEWRVFKISRQRDPDALVRFQQVREALKGLTPDSGLLPIIDYGLEPVHGLAWEELPLADSLDAAEATETAGPSGGAQGGGAGFKEYTPATRGVGAPDSAATAAATALSVVRALEFLHRRGLVHGDVKPANLLRLRGAWLLGDYDTVGVVSEAGTTLTASTEGYCPPGASEGVERDFYALGKLIYELWSGNTRLEYPSIPRRLTGVGTWSREDRLINRLIEALCHPVGLNRLGRLDVVRTVLESLQSGNAARLARAEVLLRPRGRGRLKIALGSVGGLIVAWFLILQSGWLPALPIIPSLNALVTGGSGVPAQEPVKGLVAYYPLDGDAQDHSGRGHHGTPFQLSFSADASKSPGRAGHFNGETGISIPEFPEAETNAFSMVLWFRSERLNHGKLFLKDRAVGDKDSPGRQWAVAWDAGRIKGDIWVHPEGETNRYRGHEGQKNPPKVPLGRWVHLVQTWNGQSLDLWIDGERVDTISAVGQLAEGDSPVRIGWDQYYFFKGDIDEVRLYDRALSEDEVRGMYRLGLRRAFQGWWAGGSKP